MVKPWFHLSSFDYTKRGVVSNYCFPTTSLIKVPFVIGLRVTASITVVLIVLFGALL